MAKKTAKQQSLPEMEDRVIKEIEDLAGEYADIRDQRMEMTKQEVELKGKLLAAMKRAKKENYHRDGIEVKVVREEESVKVKIKKDKEEKE